MAWPACWGRRSMHTNRCSASCHTASVSFGKNDGGGPNNRSYQISGAALSLTGIPAKGSTAIPPPYVRPRITSANPSLRRDPRLTWRFTQHADASARDSSGRPPRFQGFAARSGRLPLGADSGRSETGLPTTRSSADRCLLQIGTDGVVQLAERFDVGAAAAPFPVEDVDPLRPATDQVPRCRVIDVRVDQLGPAATLTKAVPAAVALDERPAPGALARHDDVRGADADDGAGGVAGPAELGTGLDGHRFTRGECGDLVGGEPVLHAHGLSFPDVAALGDERAHARRTHRGKSRGGHPTYP